MATTVSETAVIPLPRRGRPRSASALATLARRRAALTPGNPRQIAVPLLGPALLAMIVAPALKVATGGLHSAIDYPRRRCPGPTWCSATSLWRSSSQRSRPSCWSR